MTAHVKGVRSPAAGRLLALANVLAAAVVCAGLVLLGAGSAVAHTGLLSVTPADGAVVVAAPVTVALTFSEVIVADFATVVVTGPTGRVPNRGPARVVQGTVTQLLQRAEQPGEYRIGYRVVSADGHPISGETRFTLRPPEQPSPATSTQTVDSPTASPTSDSTPTPTPDVDVATDALTAGTSGDGGAGIGLALGGAAVLVLVGAGAVASRRRAKAPPAGRQAPNDG